MKVRKIDSLAGAPLERGELGSVSSRREWVCPKGVDRDALGAAELPQQCRPVMLAALGAIFPGRPASDVERHVGKYEDEWTPADHTTAERFSQRRRELERLWDARAGDFDPPGDIEGEDFAEDYERPRRGWRGLGAPVDPDRYFEEPGEEEITVTCRRVRRRGEERILCETTEGGRVLRGLLRERRKVRAKRAATRTRRRKRR